MKNDEQKIIEQALEALGNLPGAIDIVNEILNKVIFLPNVPFQVAVDMPYWDTINL